MGKGFMSKISLNKLSQKKACLKIKKAQPVEIFKKGGNFKFKILMLLHATRNRSLIFFKNIHLRNKSSNLSTSSCIVDSD